MSDGSMFTKKLRPLTAITVTVAANAITNLSPLIRHSLEHFQQNRVPVVRFENAEKQ